MAVGGGSSRTLVVFASIRASDSSPILVILDTDHATAASVGTSPPVPPGVSIDGEGDDNHGGFLREGVQEVELSTRCCSKSVFAASPHAVFINPSEVKAFVCQRLRHGEDLGDDVATPSSPGWWQC